MGPVQEYTAGRQSLYTTRFEFSSSIDPFLVMGAKTEFRKFFWQAKSSQKAYLTLGSLLSESSFESPLFKKFAEQRWVILAAFEARLAETSEDSVGCALHLPEVEVELSHSSQIVTLRILCDNKLDRDTAGKKLVDLFELYLPTLTQKGELPALPGLMSSSDQPSHAHWCKMVDDSKSAISEGEIDKLVLSRRKLMSFDRPANVGSLLYLLSKNSEESYLFASVEPGGSVAFIGRSPERLLSWDSEHFEVDAIAGTRRLDKSGEIEKEFYSQEQQLRSSSKDLSEHRFVSDFVESVLKSVSPKVIRTKSEQILKLKFLQHIRTSFRAKRMVDATSPFSLLSKLHPTPAVGGSPAPAALSLISDIEPEKRGLFAGSIGYGSSFEGDIAIGIRTAMLNGASLDIFAGAGIVAASDPQSEWEETELKMKNFISLFD